MVGGLSRQDATIFDQSHNQSRLSPEGSHILNITNASMIWIADKEIKFKITLRQSFSLTQSLSTSYWQYTLPR